MTQKHSGRIASASASWYRWPWVRSSSFPAGAASASSTAADRRGALRRSGPRAGPRRRRSWWPASPHGPRTPGPGPDPAGPRGPARTSRRTAPARSASPSPPAKAASSCSSAASRYSCGSLPVHRQISRPADSETCPAASAASTRGCVRDPLGPGGVPDGGAAGDAGAVDQPGHRAVVPVAGVALPGGERGQEPGPRRGRDRGVLLQFAQALGLGRGGELGGVGGGQVAQPGADHVQRLTGICRGRCTHLVTSSTGTGRRCGRFWSSPGGAGF